MVELRFVGLRLEPLMVRQWEAYLYYGELEVLKLFKRKVDMPGHFLEAFNDLVLTSAG